MSADSRTEKGDRHRGLTADLIPGLTTAAVVVPKALAYATIAQLPVQAGLFAALVPMAIYAVLGSSRLLSVSTTTPIAILCATAIGEASACKSRTRSPHCGGDTLRSRRHVGLLMARFLRLASVPNSILESVLTGFKAGVRLVIVVDQLPKLLGIHITKAGFFWMSPRSSPMSLSLVVHPCRRPGNPGDNRDCQAFPAKSPAPLLAGGRGHRRLGHHWTEATGVSVVARSRGACRYPGCRNPAVRSDVAGSRRQCPDPLPSRSPRRAPSSGVTILPLTPIASFWLWVSERRGCVHGRCPPAADLPNSGEPQRRRANAGRFALWLQRWHSQRAVLGRVLALMPHATLAAVVIAYSIGLVNPAEMADIRRVRTMEFRWAVIACLSVMVLGTLKGIVVAIVLSMAGSFGSPTTRVSTRLAINRARMCSGRARPNSRRTRPFQAC